MFLKQLVRAWPCLSGLVGNPNGIATAGPGFRRSRQLPCLFDMSRISPLPEEMGRLDGRLLLSGTGPHDGQSSQPESPPPGNLLRKARRHLLKPGEQVSLLINTRGLRQHPARGATDRAPGMRRLPAAAGG